MSRVYGDDDKTVLHAEIKSDNSIVIVSDEIPASGVLSPLAFGSSTVAQHFYLPGVDATWGNLIILHEHDNRPVASERQRCPLLNLHGGL